MRYSQFRSFEKHLIASAPSHFSSLYCIVGKDYSERMFAAFTLKKHLSKHYPQMDYQSYSSDFKGENAFFSDLKTPSLFAKRKLLHFASDEKFSKRFYQEFEKESLHFSSHTTVILTVETILRPSSFHKAIEREGVILEMGEEKVWEKEKALMDWLMERLADEKKTIEKEAARALIQGSNGNWARLAGELEKLLTYLGEKNIIELKDVEAVCVLTTSDNTWQIGEALLQCEAKRAIEMVHNALQNGYALFGLLRQLRHQLITALTIASYQQSNDRERISAKYPYLKGALLEKQIALATHYGTDRLSQAIQWVDYYEFKAKDSWDDPLLIFTCLIAKLTG